jgi:putative phosphoesterase
MKFVIASDIHGSAFWCSKLMEVVKAEQPDQLLLLGDVLYHGPRNDLPRDYAPKQVIAMLTELNTPIVCVRGNCEAEVDQMVLPFPCMADFNQFEADGRTFFLTHGHHWNPEKLPYLKDGSIFLYGHTHIKLDKEFGQIRCLNPGSVSIPKDGSNSCLVYENRDFRFLTLEG